MSNVATSPRRKVIELLLDLSRGLFISVPSSVEFRWTVFYSKLLLAPLLSALLLLLYAREYLTKFVGTDIFTILQLVLISQIILLCSQGMGNGMGKKHSHRDRKLSIKMQLGMQFLPPYQTAASIWSQWTLALLEKQTKQFRCQRIKISISKCCIFT